MYQHIQVDRPDPSRTDVYLYDYRTALVPTLRVRYGTNGPRAPLVTIAVTEEPATAAFVTGESLRLDPLTARMLARGLAQGALGESLTIALEGDDIPVTVQPHETYVLLSGRNFESVLCENDPGDIARVAKALEIVLAHADRDRR